MISASPLCFDSMLDEAMLVWPLTVDNKEGAETRAIKKAPAHADPTCQKEKNKENGLNMMLVKVHNSAASNTNVSISLNFSYHESGSPCRTGMNVKSITTE